MKFKTIELHNFGRFRGTHLINVETTETKNIILIKGYNDRGKTTLLDAINFAMYGELKGRNSRKPIEEYVNFQAASEADGTMSVEIRFEHEDDEFSIERTQRYSKSPMGEKIELDGRGTVRIMEGTEIMNLVTRESQQQWINHILPADASQFFFFDGEEIKRYIDKQSGEKVKSSIEIVLGIKELLNAREDLADIHQEFERDHRKLLKSKGKNQEDIKSMERLEVEKENIIEDINSLERNLSNAKDLVADYDKQLSRYEGIKDKVIQRKKASEELDETTQKLKVAFSEEREARSYASLLLINPLLKEIWSRDDNTPEIKNWESDIAQMLLQKNVQYCVCGTFLDDAKILTIKSKTSSDQRPSKLSIIKKMADRILVKYQPEDKKNKFIQIMQDISEYKQQESQWNDTVKKLDEEIENADKVSDIMQSLNNRRTEAYRSIGEIDARIKDAKLQKEDIIKRLKDVNLQIEKGIKDQELEKAERKENFSDKVRDAIEASIETITKRTISKIEERSSEVFKQLTNNPDLYTGLEVDESYEIRVKRYDGTVLPTYRYSPSAGASQIVATSLIAGLSKYTTREAPIIIDTPLGRLDPIHRENLIRLYSKLSSQVIIIYQPSELNKDDITLFGDSIASEWVIEKDRLAHDLSIIYQERNHL